MTDVERKPFYYGKLLASMAKADKRLLNIEDVEAVSILERLFPNNAKEAIAAYHADKNVFWLAESGHCFAASMIQLPTSEKIEILRALWTVAACDGEIHCDEEEFMEKATRQMMATPELCLEARKAVG
jgi:uncharacterized tellurite resistance protein B-like protein